MKIDRTVQPSICQPDKLIVQQPECIQLPNGIKMNVLDAGENEVVRLDFLIEGGRWGQSQPLQALFTNRMLREGTCRYTAAEIAEKLDYYGAWLELSNASEFSYITLYSLNKYLPQTLDVLESILKQPVFPEKELELVVNNNMRKFIVNSSKVDFLAHRALVKALYGSDHPCGRVVMEEDYQHIHSSVLRQFYDRHYHSGGCTIYLSGKISDACLQRVEQMFGIDSFGNAQYGSAVRNHFVPVSDGEKRYFVERQDALQSAVRIGALSLDYTHPDYLKTRVMITLLGGYFGSRLMSNIREEKGYTYGISASIIPYPDNGMLVIGAETTNELVEPLIREVYHEIERLQNELVCEKELTIVKNYMLGEMCRNCESAFSLADAWIFVHTSRLTATYFSDSLEAIKGVTPQEIRELAGRYLCKETLKEVVSGKKIS